MKRRRKQKGPKLHTGFPLSPQYPRAGGLTLSLSLNTMNLLEPPLGIDMKKERFKCERINWGEAGRCTLVKKTSFGRMHHPSAFGTTMPN